MFHLFRYRIPDKYFAEFKDAYSYINVRQITILSSVILVIAIGVRMTWFFYHAELLSMPNLLYYNTLNWVQIFCSGFFLMLSNFALKAKNWKTKHRDFLVMAFCLFILTSSFSVSYLFSLSNPKNTLTMFLIGVVAVSIFFALEFKQIIMISVYVILLFVIGMLIPDIGSRQKLLNMIMSGVLAFFLYSSSRYGYYFKADQFVKVKQLEEKNEEVQMLNHQKGEILGFVAHDLRNPLNNIEALARILLEEDEQKQNTELQLILSSTRQAKHIINDLIEVVQRDKSPLQLHNTNMIDFITEICNSWQKNVNKERKINLQATDPTLMAAINTSKLTRVIDNLIGNGLKFSSPETPINIEVSKSEKAGMIRITDFGIGIPDDLQSFLFDQFSKAGRDGLKGEKSIGLGLHISKQIIEQHGGTLLVKSTENQGTTFQISLPLVTAV